MNNILVTGCCGFIGSNFVHYMLKNHTYRLINLDALTYAGNPENLEGVKSHNNYKFIHGRIEDTKLVNQILSEEKISAIIHFAAESHVDRSIADAAPFIQTNVFGTYALLESARKNNISRFIHISTDEVYGSLGEIGAFTEETPLASNSPYSASKAASDMLVRSYMHTHDLPAIIMRCSNNYGPYQFPEKFIPLIISNLLGDQPIPLYGDGLNVRDWIYVEDFCSAIDTVLHKGQVGHVYNVGGQSERKNIEVVRHVLEHLSKPQSCIKFVQDRPGHDRRYAMDITKINKELGWSPRYSFDEGIKLTIKWYQENRDWWQRVKSGDYLKYYEQMYAKRMRESKTHA